MKIKYVLGILALCLNSTAFAAQDIDTRGIGAYSCDWLMTTLSTSTSEESTITVAMAISWIQGDHTGKNSKLPMNQRRDLQGLTAEKIASDLDTMCLILPEAYLYEISNLMFEGLPYLQGAAS